MWCLHFFTPSLVFIGGSNDQQGCLLQLFLQEPTYTSNEQAPHGRLEAVGPTGPSADQGGRPATQWGHRPSSFVLWADLWAHLSLACDLTFVMSVSCSGGPSNPCFDTCYVLICWNIVSWIMPHRYATKLALIHLDTFSNIIC